MLANDPAAVPPNGDEPAPNFLLAAALAIEDNLLWCERQAIALTGSVLHLLSTRITGNEVLGCRDVGISALGLGAAGIVDEDQPTTASTLRAAASAAASTALWIEGNKLRQLGRTRSRAQRDGRASRWRPGWTGTAPTSARSSPTRSAGFGAPAS